MPKSIISYWNPLIGAKKGRWTPVKGLEGMAEELTLSIDESAGEYTRLTGFLPEADATPFGGKSHKYPEEVFVVSGRVYHKARDTWIGSGHYAIRPPGETHGEDHCF